MRPKIALAEVNDLMHLLFHLVLRSITKLSHSRPLLFFRLMFARPKVDSPKILFGQNLNGSRILAFH